MIPQARPAGQSGLSARAGVPGVSLSADTMMTPWFLYLIRAADNRLYTGVTTDVARRLMQHQQGKGAKALRGRGALRLAFVAEVGERSLALRLEYRVRRLTKRQKEGLVAGDGVFEALLARLQSQAAKNA